MHTAIGIDMSKDSFHAALDDMEVRQFANTKDGFAVFAEALRTRGVHADSCAIGTEATGIYHLPFAMTLKERGWHIVVINPLITHRVIRARLRQVKTDRHDAIAIRQALLAGAGYPFTDTPEVLALKTLVAERDALVRMRVQAKQERHVRVFKAPLLPEELPDCFPLIENALTREIKTIERRMRRYMPEAQKLLRSIPGIGALSAAALVSYVGDVNRFSSPEKLVAYIGLDCRVHESGTSIHGKGYITKRGNAYLRHILFNAALIAKRHNPALAAYYGKKRLEGKHHFSALCAVERKLIHVVYAVWKRGTPFVTRATDRTAPCGAVLLCTAKS